MGDLKRILVVDDIYANRFLMKEIIKTAGYECLQAENGKEAIDIIEVNVVDLVFMDIEMPVMNGLETVLFIRKNMPIAKSRLPIIALTAHNPQLFFDDYRDVEFNEILTKPYSTDRVLSMIKKFLVEV
jgi:CheY-like chemotaxis protein